MSITAMKQALEVLQYIDGSDNKRNFLWPNECYQLDEAITALRTAIEAAEKQEPVATVIEELEHDGQGFCAKVRWLYNPVPVDETLFWSQK